METIRQAGIWLRGDPWQNVYKFNATRNELGIPRSDDLLVQAAELALRNYIRLSYFELIILSEQIC